MNLFISSWKGEASLAKAFWLVYVLFSIILSIIITVIFSMAVSDFSYIKYQPAIMAILFPYTLFSAICVWRCAKNSIVIWRILARIIVVLAVIGGILNVVQAVKQPSMSETTNSTMTTQVL